MSSVAYEIKVLETFEESMDCFPRKVQERIHKKIKEILVKYPYRYSMLKGIYPLRGKSLVGLRKFKTGLEGHRGGVYVLYIVLFLARPRELGY